MTDLPLKEVIAIIYYSSMIVLGFIGFCKVLDYFFPSPKIEKKQENKLLSERSIQKSKHSIR